MSKTPAKKSARASHDFNEVFAALRALLTPYEKKLLVEDGERVFSLSSKTSVDRQKNPLFFAATRLGRAYVSYYLFPVYLYPEMLEGMSPQLKKQMQGKSCFNFKKIDRELFKELDRLTKRGFERFKKEGLI